ncbi:hypothetical protein KY328_03670 [Candidatus Woesearchaeota archaeon]|nr:hypothetical protein [Candidatus Woesearchaeota archaeon]MBW3021994.1 hypothetical protein [Candidatus Woesearchaeota archaeon]
MKKLLALLVVLVLASMAIAQGPQGIHDPGTGIEQPELKEAGQGTGQGLEQGADVEPVMVSEQQQNQATATQIREQNRVHLQTGLQTALGRVTNENARQRLQQNIDMFQQKYQERMQRFEELEISDVDAETGAVMVRAKEQVKYLGFIKGKATKRFEMDASGNVVEKKPWYRFMYSESV